MSLESLVLQFFHFSVFSVFFSFFMVFSFSVVFFHFFAVCSVLQRASCLNCIEKLPESFQKASLKTEKQPDN